MVVRTFSSRLILKTAVSPRKARKTRNKSVRFVDLAIHPLGDDLQLGISLKIFVLPSAMLRTSFGRVD